MSLDPTEGVCYIELVRYYEESEDELDQIYKIIVCDQGWINSMEDVLIAWDRESS